MPGDPRSLREAQLTLDSLRTFEIQLADFEAEGVLTLSADQRAKLTEHLRTIKADLARRFDVDTSESQRRLSWGLRIASALGAVALSIALFLLVRRYWGLWPTSAQVVALVTAPLVGLVLTEVIARRERSLHVASLMSLMTLAAFIIDLATMGRIFNIVATPNALLAWGSCAIALAYHYGFRLQLAAGLCLLVSYLAATWTSWWGYDWLTFAERPEWLLLGGTGGMVLPSAVAHSRRTDFPQVYRLVGAVVALGAIFALARAGTLSVLPFSTTSIEVGYELVGYVAAASLIVLCIRRRWPEIVNTSAVYFGLFLVARMYDWWWESLPAYLFFALVGALALGLIAVFTRLRLRLAEVR